MARRGVVVAGVALLLAGIAGASSAELPRGWWKGTIVLEERWDQIVDNTGVKFSEKGSATVRITRTAPDKAAYEVTYREETRWVGECAGALRYVKSASLEKSGPVDVAVPIGRGRAAHGLPGSDAADCTRVLRVRTGHAREIRRWHARHDLHVPVDAAR